MALANSPVKVGILKTEADHIIRTAQQAALGGKSRVRGADRMTTLMEDQCVGMIAEAALHKYWFGHLTYWCVQRFYQNRAPYSGDGGSDIYATNLDVKGSLIRDANKPLESYHLVVRPGEFRGDWVYVLALVAFLQTPPELEAGVFLMGWADSDMFPVDVDKEGVFAGAYTLKADQLHPMMPLRHRWR